MKNTNDQNYVKWFRNAAPYINAHRGKTVVLMFGGEAGTQKHTEQWNGSSWTEVADVSKGRTNSIGTGSTTSAINAFQFSFRDRNIEAGKIKLYGIKGS